MWEDYLSFGIKMMSEAGKIIRPYAGRVKKQAMKLKKDFVTDMDVISEQFLMKQIQEHYPSHRIFSEEYGTLGESGDFEWVLDPIDGTVNYSIGLPLYGISAALLFRDEPVVSIISLPAFGEMFWATKGGGAFLDGKPIRIKEVEPAEAFVSFGDFNKDGDPINNQLRLEKLAAIVNDVFRIRMIGSAAIGLPYIAMGRLDAAVYYQPNRYDVLGGQLIITEAGGTVSSIGDWTVYSSKTVADFLVQKLSS